MPASRKRAARRTTKKPPWKRAAPGTSKHRKLSPSQKAKAKRRAKRAGRPYPNLVDNMQAARGDKKRS
jgi:hypothetical protein